MLLHPPVDPNPLGGSTGAKLPEVIALLLRSCATIKVAPRNIRIK